MQEFDVDQELEQGATSTGDWVKRIALLLGVIIVIGAIGYGIKGLFSGGEVKKKNITKLTFPPDKGLMFYAAFVIFKVIYITIKPWNGIIPYFCIL